MNLPNFLHAFAKDIRRSLVCQIEMNLKVVCTDHGFTEEKMLSRRDELKIAANVTFEALFPIPRTLYQTISDMPGQ